MRIAAGLMLFVAVLAPEAGAEPSTVRVTTDTPEYCGVLAQRLSMMPAAQEEPARSLGEAGRRMCSTGHARAGVARLRRALRAARAGQSAPAEQSAHLSQATGE